MTTERLPLKLFYRLGTDRGGSSNAYSVLEAALMLAAMVVLLVVSCLAFGWEKLTRSEE